VRGGKGVDVDALSLHHRTSVARSRGASATALSQKAAFRRSPDFGLGGLVPVAASSGTYGSGVASYGADPLRSWKNKHTLLVATSFVVLELTNWYRTAAATWTAPRP
jgi:hypothetical protein